MHRERLSRLADLLEADAANPTGVRFDLETWAEYSGRETFPERLKKLDCQTQACAVGLACLSGIFLEDGLMWKPSWEGEENNITPLYDEFEGFDAVEKFFGITFSQATRLFASNSYPFGQKIGRDAELAVAARIRLFIEPRAEAA